MRICRVTVLQTKLHQKGTKSKKFIEPDKINYISLH